MHHHKPQTANTHKNRTHSPLQKLAAIALLSITSACSSTAQPRLALVAVIDKQNELLQAVNMERAGPIIRQKIEADPELQAAEAHLQAALQMLIQSNAMIKTSL